MPDNLSIVHEIKRVGTAIKDKLEIKRENKKPRVTRQKILDYHLDYDILASWLKTQFPGFDKEIDDMENRDKEFYVMLPEELSASDLKHIDTELRRKPDQIDRSIAFPS